MFLVFYFHIYHNTSIINNVVQKANLLKGFVEKELFYMYSSIILQVTFNTLSPWSQLFSLVTYNHQVNTGFWLIFVFHGRYCKHSLIKTDAAGGSQGFIHYLFYIMRSKTNHKPQGTQVFTNVLNYSYYTILQAVSLLF